MYPSIERTGAAAEAYCSRTIEELYELIPQEVAVDQGLVKNLGETALISCRDFTDDNAERLARLSPKEYQTLLLASESLPYKKIAAVTGRRFSTITSQLHSVFVKLDVPDKIQAGTFIPMEMSRLHRPEIRSILGKRQREVFEYLADGLTSKQISEELSIAESTVRTQTLYLRDKLDIRGTVSLARMAGALRNLDLYQDAAGTAAVAQTLKPRVTSLLRAARRYADSGQIRLDAPALRRTADTRLLEQLESGGYLTREAAANGALDLAGVAAAMLMKEPETARMLQDKFMRPIARTLIQKEVSFYLGRRKNISRPAFANIHR